MRVAKRHTLILGLLSHAALCGLGGCGIEVGNPHSGSGSTTTKPSGLISMQLADAPIDSAKHVYLGLQTLSLVPLNDDGSEGTPVPLALANPGQVDALALQNGKTLGLLDGQSLPVGNYDSVIIGLGGSSPASIVDASGHQDPISFANSASQIIVAQQFAISDSQTLSLLLHLDLRRSIHANTGADQGANPFSFSPVANLNVAGDQAELTGSGGAASLTEVCAYLFRQTPDNDEGPLNHPGPPPGRMGGNDGPPAFPTAITAQPPTSFGPGQSFDPTTDTSSCTNAYAVASVAGGSFSMEHLWPGNYQLLFYTSSGARAAIAPLQVAINPGQTSNVTIPALSTSSGSGTSGNGSGTTGNGSGT